MSKKNRDLKTTLRLVTGGKNASPAQNTQPSQTPPPSSALSNSWNEATRHDLHDTYIEDGELAFYEQTGFPEEQTIWHAHLQAAQAYLLTTGLDTDYRYSLYTRNCLYPAQVLAQYGADQFGEEDTSIATVISAALLWRSVKETPDLAYNDDIVSPLALDIIHELIDYYDRGTSYDDISNDAQSVILAVQICDIAEAANVMDNWAYKLAQKELTADDVNNAKTLHQAVLMEKWIDPAESGLMSLLDRELGRLRDNLDDNRPIIPQKDKKRAFRVISNNKK